MRPCLGRHLWCLLWPMQTLALKEGGDVTDTRLFAFESLIIRYDKMVSHGILRARRRNQELSHDRGTSLLEGEGQ
jgi:hypothetical protein